MLQLPDVIRLLNDLLSPVVILGIQLVGPEAELAGGGTNDLFIIDVQGDPVAIGKLLGQGFLVAPLYLLQVTGAIDFTELFVQERLELCLWEAVSPLLMSGTILYTVLVGQENMSICVYHIKTGRVRQKRYKCCGVSGKEGTRERQPVLPGAIECRFSMRYTDHGMEC